MKKQESNLKIETCTRESFAVIGKEGSTRDGEGFIGKLWMEANGHFDEIAHLVKMDDQKRLTGIWGLMSDFSRTFQPWEKDFSEGLYLAGAECEPEAEVPDGWTKWIVPGFTYISVEKEDGSTFGKALKSKLIPERTIAVKDWHMPAERS